MSNLSKKARNEVRSRKNYETELNRARLAFAKAKTDFEQYSKEQAEAQARLDDARNRLDAAKKAIQHISDQVRIMDLTGATATKQRGNDVSYIVDGNECYINATDMNNIEMTPWKKRPTKEVADVADVDDASDDNSVVDAVPALAAIINEINGLKKTAKPERAAGYQQTLDRLKALRKEASALEYVTMVSEIKDMARGLNPGYLRDYQFPNWKDQDFKQLLEELNN